MKNVNNQIHTIILGCLLVGTVTFGVASLFIPTQRHILPPHSDKVVESAQISPVAQSLSKAAINHPQLPTDEEPVTANVSDREKLQNQKFFEKSQNGDLVLMYPKNKKVFLYRPASDQVVAQAPLDYKTSPKPQNP